MSTTTFNTATLRRIVRAGTNSSFGSRPGMRRHQWTEQDLQELSLAYLEYKGQMPLWKIADMLQFSFSSPKPSRNEDDDDAPMVMTPPNPTNTRAPSIPAIMSKLMDCVYLETGGLLGYETVKPSLLHCQVWKHVRLSQKHREMIAEMKIKSEENAAKCCQPEEPEPQPQSSFSSSSHRCSIGKVRGRKSDDDDECPPAKRRKIITDDDDEEHIDHDHVNIQAVMASLDQRLANLSLQFGGVFAEIESIRGEITNALLPSTTTTTTTTTPVCSKCDKLIEGELGGFSVSYADPSQPQGTYECYECCSLSPSELEFITRRQSELQAEYEAQGQQPVSPLYSGYDSDEYWEEDYHNGCDYDHGEECS
jgi:hypothetical protein